METSSLQSCASLTIITKIINVLIRKTIPTYESPVRDSDNPVERGADMRGSHCNSGDPLSRISPYHVIS